jgi:DNA repair protein RecO (recombination protein O)
MDWTDSGLIIGARRHGESSVILEVMTRDHGRHLGLVRGGRSRSMQPVIQAGNRVSVAWRARLEEHLGLFTIEPLVSRTAQLMATPLALHGLNHLSGLLHLLPERDPHPALYDMADAVAAHLDDPALAPELLVRFELALLADFGFGLDLEQCALSGVSDDLAWVSPKSGRAVSRAAGAQWEERLLALPAFLASPAGQGEPSAAALVEAFALTGHFMRRELFEPRGIPLPAARDRFLVDLAARLAV